ncbi:hypothetical protein POSPLADRAFT_1052745 [Postia placenta MAD-698-R-SB12]|uniref:Uncharacterized protein n=1 Tax=Postia placenta MAD-698-R-SB12 TaxID=670580 RepID=A0A1X6NBQ0_9APHY|nr:hypothetical protein POSPLADRAFT_1052745 [Postia placenta MAD-698-R-SB12]OSX66065.1 hypothetical protein POSPLADRAFT_1052745 [Postia placenta MAD-698-R-SB12]
MLASAFIAFALAASVLAIPTLFEARQNNPCAGFASGSTDTPGYNFTLHAVPVGASANDTGELLVFGYGPEGGSSPAAGLLALTTEASWGQNQWPFSSMQNGSVYPQPGPQEQGLYAYSNGANAGQEVIFVDTTAQEDIFTLTSVGAGSFCAALVDDVVALAVNGDTNSFSLCNATSNWVEGQVNVVYSPVANNTDYIYDTCSPVRVELISYYG